MTGVALTVLGPVPVDELGHTQTHEHIFTDISWVKHRWDLPVLEDESHMTEEVELYREAGGGTLVEVTPRNIGRKPEGLRRVSQATGVHVIMGTGWYRQPYYPPEIDRTPTSELAAVLVHEIEHGWEESGIRPGIIGEIGCDKRWISGVEERVFRAAARAHVATGLAITTHTPPHTALKMHALLTEEGADPSRIVYGHLDNTLEIDYLTSVLATGGYAQFDLIGIHTINSDTRRAKTLVELVRAGHTARLLIAQDVGTRNRLATNGGHGYGYVLNEFLPLLSKEGLSDDEIEMLTKVNPHRVLAVDEQ